MKQKKTSKESNMVDGSVLNIVVVNEINHSFSLMILTLFDGELFGNDRQLMEHNDRKVTMQQVDRWWDYLNLQRE